MISGRGIGYIKAPHRKLINLFGEFTIHPSVVERVVDGQVVGYKQSGDAPYIEVVNPCFTAKWPKKVTMIIVSMPNRIDYVLHEPIVMSRVDKRTIRFEGVVACEGIEL